MAIEYPVLIRSFEAGKDLSTKQYYPVRLSGTTVDLCSAVTARAIGVLQNKPSANETADVMMIGVSKYKVGDANTTAGAYVGVQASGRCADLTPASAVSASILGITLVAGTASGLGSLILQPQRISA